MATLTTYLSDSASACVTQAQGTPDANGNLHRGQDIQFSPLYYSNLCAPIDGVVTVSQLGGSGTSWTYGEWVELSTAAGIVRMAHMRSGSRGVVVGQSVKAGDYIGQQGNTGNVSGVTGIHLHIELIVNGQIVNPASISGFPNTAGICYDLIFAGPNPPEPPEIPDPPPPKQNFKSGVIGLIPSRRFAERIYRR